MKPKVCTKCRQEKPIEQFDHFFDKSRGKERVRAHCKDCRRQMVKKHDSENVEKKSEYNKSYREKKSDYLSAKSKEYYAENRDKILSYLKAWRQSNPDIVAYHGVKKRQRKRQATPSWLTEDHKIQIKQVYAHAKDCSFVGEGSYEVDHIVPLQGRDVCGLHVPWNLQVLPADINRAKNNRHDPDIYSPTNEGTA